MAVAVFFCLLVAAACSAAAVACPNNCTGDPCNSGGKCLCLHPSNEPDCSIDWANGAHGALVTFVAIFSLLFGVIMLVSAAQLVRWLYYTGMRINVPKLLHVVIFVQAVFRVAWFLSGGLDILGHNGVQTMAEGIIDGLGIAMLVVCYQLCILLWLQVLNQVTPPGERRNACIRHRTQIIALLICLYLAVEVAVRVVWNLSDDAEVVFLAISFYHVIVLLATLMCSVAFVVISVYLYRVLRETDRTPASRERMLTMMSFTTFTLIISVVTLLLSLVFFLVEFIRFGWVNWDSWLIEQTLMRLVEAAYSVGTLWFLRRVPPHEVMPERRSLLTPDTRKKQGDDSLDRSGSMEDDSAVRRQLNASMDRAALAPTTVDF